VHTVLLLRHGESTWNTENRVQGWAPTPLTARGVEQAAAAGRLLAAEYDVDRVVASDLRRTRETTVHALHAAGWDHDPTFDRAWRERSMGQLQGLTVEEAYGGHPEYSLLHSGVHGARATPPGGESFLEMRQRVLDGWDALTGRHEGGTTLVVSHGGPIFALLAHVQDRDFLSTLGEGWATNGSVAELRVDGDGAEVVRTNLRPDGVAADGGDTGDGDGGADTSDEDADQSTEDRMRGER
jgi:probable phosphoglycerate mutase